MNFGVITACCQNDYFMVKATCASIRFYMPSLPICVIIDGDFCVSELIKLYGVIPLYVSDFKHSSLRKICPGSPRAKLAAIWESPFESFICIDSDIIVWGNVQSEVDLENFDFNIFTPGVTTLEQKEIMSYYHFDIDRMKLFDSSFVWLGMPFFCAGAFGARKGCLNLETYIKLEEYAKSNAGLFNFAEQGIFNYMVLKNMQLGTMRVKVTDIQYIVVDHPLRETKKICKMRMFKPPKTPPKITLIHFCGRKPLIQNLQAYSRPFTGFRYMHYQNLYGGNIAGKLRSWYDILNEEIHVARPRVVRKVKKIFSCSRK